jgi:hypothetical protein
MYKLQKDSLSEKIISVQRFVDGASIPFDPANTDYIAYLAWLAEGNVPEPAEVTE